MSEPEDPEVIAMRERAERVAARRAKERAEATRSAADKPSEAPKKGRRWYHWVFDGALVLMAAYVIKTRFLDKPEPPPPPKPSVAASASAHASTSASSSVAPSTTTRATAELRLGPGQAFALVETVPPHTAVEVLEVSSAGFVKVKVPSGKTGWVRADDLAFAR